MSNLTLAALWLAAMILIYLTKGDDDDGTCA